MEPTTTAAMDGEIGAWPSGAALHVNSDERLEGPAPASSLTQAGLWLALSAAVALHAIVAGLLILEYFWAPGRPSPAEEIPVEIVVETPQPKPPPPAAPNPEPSLKTQSLDEEPARDAPRAANDEKIERPAQDERTKAPANENTAKTPGEETAEKEAAPSRDLATRQTPEPPQPASDKAAESSDGAVPANSDSPEAESARAATAAAAKAATLIGQPFPDWSKGGKFSTFDSLPDVDFSSAAEATTVAGGKAKKTYLTVLYGMIMAHVHYADAARGHVEGEITFIVDGTGHLLQRQISRPSGSRELDAVALGAVAEAGPFPPPPQGLPVRLRFTYGSK